jgi:hydroxymethylbilane synthase
LKPLRIGTRSSPLALWQARTVAAAVASTGGPSCEVVTIKTTGDRLSAAVLSEVGGKATFVKEIEHALLGDEIDIAVHSAKDLPAELPAGLSICAVLRREDPRDALALPAGQAVTRTDDTEALVRSLSPEPRIGTGSVRRTAQLAIQFPTAKFEQIRGNVGTRLRKLDAGEYDLLVLAAAGLIRLGLVKRISVRLSFDECLPAPGQGIVAIETRTGDRETASVLSAINDRSAMAALEAERALLGALGGDCRVPIGGVATPDGQQLALRAVVASIDGSRVLREQQHGRATDAGQLGRRVGDALIAAGAADIIAGHRV